MRVSRLLLPTAVMGALVSKWMTADPKRLPEVAAPPSFEPGQGGGPARLRGL